MSCRELLLAAHRLEPLSDSRGADGGGVVLPGHGAARLRYAGGHRSTGRAGLIEIEDGDNPPVRGLSHPQSARYTRHLPAAGMKAQDGAVVVTSRPYRGERGRL